MTKERAAHIILNLIQKEEETGSYSLLKVEVDALKKAYCSLVPELFTNADRIRSMTDEELAEMLNHAQGDGYLVGIGQRKMSAYGNWLEWLKQEATE